MSAYRCHDVRSNFAGRVGGHRRHIGSYRQHRKNVCKRYNKKRKALLERNQPFAIVLSGVSSSGKTSIAKELMLLISRLKTCRLWQSLALDTISDLAIDGDPMFEFIDGKPLMLSGENCALLSAVQGFLKRGVCVVVDSVFDECGDNLDLFVEKLNPYECIPVLVYCDPFDAVERAGHRNSRGVNDSEYRLPIQPIEQLTTMFQEFSLDKELATRKRKPSHHIVIVGELDKDDVQNICTSPVLLKQNGYEPDRWVSAMENTFHLSDPSTPVLLSPRATEYVLSVNTTESDPASCAKTIFDFVFNGEIDENFDWDEDLKN
jgi:hypothetical protein